MLNYDNLCTKYLSYSQNNNNAGKIAILNQIINSGLANNLIQAFQVLQMNCLERGYNYANEFTPPTDNTLEPTSAKFVDCYRCDDQIMQRYPFGTQCPEGFISSPVSPVTNTSKNPCPFTGGINPLNPDASRVQKISNVGGTRFEDGILRGGIRSPERDQLANTREFNIFDSPDQPNEDQVRVKNIIKDASPERPNIERRTKNDIQVVMGNIARVNGGTLIGKKLYINRPDGSTMIVDYTPTTPDTGKKACGGRCKYKVRKGIWPFRRTIGKYKGTCQKMGDGCMCGSLQCGERDG